MVRCLGGLGQWKCLQYVTCLIMPNKKCFVLHCQNPYEFRFPIASRQAWLDAIGRPSENPKPGNGLCADHFSSEDYAPLCTSNGECTANGNAFFPKYICDNFPLYVIMVLSRTSRMAPNPALPSFRHVSFYSQMLS